MCVCVCGGGGGGGRGGCVHIWVCARVCELKTLPKCVSYTIVTGQQIMGALQPCHIPLQPVFSLFTIRKDKNRR